MNVLICLTLLLSGVTATHAVPVTHDAKVTQNDGVSGDLIDMIIGSVFGSDFVAKDENFLAYAGTVAGEALAMGGTDVEALMARDVDV